MKEIQKSLTISHCILHLCFIYCDVVSVHKLNSSSTRSEAHSLYVLLDGHIASISVALVEILSVLFY